MTRTVINPWPWSIPMGFNQAELSTGESRTLYCSGQTSVDADMTPLHPGDMRGQLSAALDNVETVLAGAGMTLANVIRLNIYTTDIDGYFEHAGALVSRLGGAGVAPPGTLVEVRRLALPELMVELEATAVA